MPHIYHFVEKQLTIVNYSLHVKALKRVSSAKYLSVRLKKDLNCCPHPSNAQNQAFRRQAGKSDSPSHSDRHLPVPVFLLPLCHLHLELHSFHRLLLPAPLMPSNAVLRAGWAPPLSNSPSSQTTTACFLTPVPSPPDTFLTYWCVHDQCPVPK